MKTLQEELARAKANYDREVAELQRKHGVLALLPLAALEKHGEPFVHSYSIYGSVGSIHFKRYRYESLRYGAADPDRALLAELLEAFPPLPLAKVHDGSFTSFRPMDAAPLPSEHRPQTKTPIAPIIVRIDAEESEACYEWYSQVKPGDHVWHFRITYSRYKIDLGTLHLEYSRYPDGTVASVTRCSFSPRNHVQVKAYGSGSHNRAGSFMLYWPQPNTDLQTIINTVKD